MHFSGDKRTVIDGPFAETKELIAGYWLWQVKSKEEAIEWVKRCPNPMPGTEAEIEIRQVFEMEDFGEEFTPELREQEERAWEQAKELSTSSLVLSRPGQLPLPGRDRTLQAHASNRIFMSTSEHDVKWLKSGVWREDHDVVVE